VLYLLQFSLQEASPETFEYTLIVQRHGLDDEKSVPVLCAMEVSVLWGDSVM
jgi:hypothetical protein